MPTNRKIAPDVTGTDDLIFAPIPSWERNRNHRGFGAARRATAPANPADAANEAPTYVASTAARRNGSTAPIAIAAGIIALGGLAAAGWYATQPHDAGIAQLTPGSASTSTTTTASGDAIPPSPTVVASNDATAPPAETAAVSPPASTSTVTATTRTTTHAVPARARPAASSSVGDAGVNASATLPAAPMPYSGAAMAPTTVNPAPMTTTPAPTPVAPDVAPMVNMPAPATDAPTDASPQ